MYHKSFTVMGLIIQLLCSFHVGCSLAADGPHYTSSLTIPPPSLYLLPHHTSSLTLSTTHSGTLVLHNSLFHSHTASSSPNFLPLSPGFHASLKKTPSDTSSATYCSTCPLHIFTHHFTYAPNLNLLLQPALSLV